MEGTTITSLEKRIGASKGVLSRALNNNSDIQSKWIQLIVENYPLYDAEWLLTGKGQMLKSDVPVHSNVGQEKDVSSIPVMSVDFSLLLKRYENLAYENAMKDVKIADLEARLKDCETKSRRSGNVPYDFSPQAPLLVAEPV